MLRRNEFGRYLNRRNLSGQGAEIGVAQGAFSAEILNNWDGRVLYLVDTWAPQAPETYIDAANVSQQGHWNNLRLAIDRVQAHTGRFEIIRGWSTEAAANFRDDSLDFVYIDANHRYPAVVQDLRAWFPKLRSGGVLAGHDYVNGRRGGTEFGVQPAVDEFAAEKGLDIAITNEEWPTWLSLKIPHVEHPHADICVVTAFDKRQACLGAISAPNKAKYCARHGYSFYVATAGFDASRPPAWSKVLFVLEQLRRHDWVFWSDADAVIMNDRIRIEKFIDPQYDLILSREDVGVGCSAINSGNFLIRRSEWALAFLERVYAQTRFINSGSWEQAAIIHLINTEDIGEHVKVVPQCGFNSFPRNFKPDHFMLHLAGISVHDRLRILQERGFERPSAAWAI